MYGIEGSFCFFFSQYSPCVNCFWIYQSQPFYLLLDVLPPPHFLLLKITAINTFIFRRLWFFFHRHYRKFRNYWRSFKLPFEYITFQSYFCVCLYGNIFISFYIYTFVAYFRILKHILIFLCLGIEKTF